MVGSHRAQVCPKAQHLGAGDGHNEKRREREREEEEEKGGAAMILDLLLSGASADQFLGFFRDSIAIAAQRRLVLMSTACARDETDTCSKDGCR